MISFGTDPEFMITRDRKLVSAISVVRRSIEEKIVKDGHAFYYDNVLAECAIRPAESADEAVNNIGEALRIYSEIIAPARLEAWACRSFPASELKHPKAREVGCAPDYCAYAMQMMPPPKEAIMSGNRRSCGGHIHLGHDCLTSDGTEPIVCVYLLDLVLGSISLRLDKDPESSTRRQIYGQPGRYRPKPYGLEYRVLSNFWLRNPSLVRLMYELSSEVVSLTEKGVGDDFWTLDFDKYVESQTEEEMAAAWTCAGYDPTALRKGIQNSDIPGTEVHYQLARSLLSGATLDLLDKCLESDPDFHSSWNI